MKCKDCEHLLVSRGEFAVRKTYICYHPENKLMFDYCRKHNISKYPPFICYGSLKNNNEPTAKTSPKYCPIKLLESGDTE